MSNTEIKIRQLIIIDILKGLEDEKIIESQIRIPLKKKEDQLIEIKDLTHQLLRRANNIYFLESLKLD